MLRLFLFFLLAGCGVKGPPVPVVRPEEPIPLKLDCAPTDPECDRTDPNYTPQK